MGRNARRPKLENDETNALDDKVSRKDKRRSIHTKHNYIIGEIDPCPIT